MARASAAEAPAAAKMRATMAVMPSAETTTGEAASVTIPAPGG